jgi:hypothetical protein
MTVQTTLAAALIFAAQVAAAQNAVDAPTFDWGGRIPAGSTLRISSVDGDIRVTATSGDQVQVHGERRGITSGARALLFQVVRAGDDVTVCAYYPGGSCDSEGPHDHGVHFGNPPRADFTVQLPAGVKLATHTADGDIDVQHAGADVSAHSGDGKIFVTTASGDVDASSGDGDIEARVAAAPSLRSLRLHSGDGTVTVVLPSNFAGDVDANTGDGTVESDFPLEFSGRMNPHHMHGTIGGGGSAHIDVSTGDGDVVLRKG